MNLPSLPSISIVVPVYNGGNAFRKCLVSLSRWLPQPAHLRTEVIVVSDGESDGSWRVAERFSAEEFSDKGLSLKVIRLQESKGPARARNIGASKATGDIVFFVDADVEILPDTIERVARSFADDARLAALIGSYDDAPGAPNFLSQYKNLFHHYTHQTACLDASTFWGACGAVRRSVFQEVGGFDENYRKPCIEDIELGYRLKQAGYTIHLRKDIQVKHLKRWTPVSLLRADIFYRALPWMALLLQVRQHQPAQYERFTSDLNLKWDSRISVMLVYGLLVAVAIASWPFGWEPFGLLNRAGLTFAIVFCVALVLVNFQVYRFFRQKRGWLFALKTVPWHWLYFFYSGLAYVITLIRHQFRSGRTEPAAGSGSIGLSQ